MQLQGRKARWQVQKFRDCFRLTSHATTIKHTLILWKCQGEPHLLLCIKLWVTVSSTGEYQNENERRVGLLQKKRGLSIPHPPWWICKIDPWCLTEDKLRHGPLFRYANLWMVVTITWDTMKSISSPLTSKCYWIFKCHNRKIKYNSQNSAHSHK